MFNLYDYIEMLCKERNITITQMCREAGVPRANLTELKKGRQQTLGMAAIGKLALYFGKPMDCFYGLAEEKEKAPSGDPEEDMERILRFALFDGEDVSDDGWQMVVAFAKLVKEREKKKKESDD